jgi:hypothetical protein
MITREEFYDLSGVEDPRVLVFLNLWMEISERGFFLHRLPYCVCVSAPTADEPQESRAAVPLWHRVHCPTLTRRRTFSGTTRRCTTTCATTISTKSKPESKLSNEGKYTGSGNGNDKHRAIAEERNAMECPATMRLCYFF